jgi:hypothetical protein
LSKSQQSLAGNGTIIAMSNRAEEQMMKRLFGLLIATAVLATIASPAFAQNCRRRTYYEPARSSQGYNDSSSVYYGDPSVYYDYRYRRSFWDRHRDKLTVAAGTAGGAVIGALVGGRRGAAIGAISGAAGSAVYTYRIRSRRYPY